MYSIKFNPIYKECIWGGTNLKRVFARDFSGDHIGESWDLSSHANGTSIVKNGSLAGKSLNELLAENSEKIMGKKFAHEKQFPLLIEIIDANDDLSIQVHPDDHSACKLEGEAGKTEAWYVVSAKENAQIVYGLKNDITNLYHGSVEQLSLGDTVLIPACLGEFVVKGDLTLLKIT